jgi:hypothetical protein
VTDGCEYYSGRGLVSSDMRHEAPFLGASPLEVGHATMGPARGCQDTKYRFNELGVGGLVAWGGADPHDDGESRTVEDADAAGGGGAASAAALACMSACVRQCRQCRWAFRGPSW